MLCGMALICMCTDGCTAETTLVGLQQQGVLNISLDWPESDLGELVRLQCPCGNLADIGRAIRRTATRVCGGTFSSGAVWEMSMDQACDLSITTRRLCEVANVSSCMHACCLYTHYSSTCTFLFFS